MKPKLILCLALVLSGGLLGCSTVDYHSANSKQSRLDLYLHLIADYPYPKPPQTILSAPVRLSTDFDIPMGDGQHLNGRIEPRNGKFFVYFRVPLYDGTNIFNGEVSFDKLDEPWGQPRDDKVPFIFWTHFVLSANSSPKSFLKQVADGERKHWEYENPLTGLQLAEVKKNFHLMRPGMTEDEVFTMLGLSGYQHRLNRSSHARSLDWNIGNYQLADKDRLMLFFDDTGVKTYKDSFGENGAFGNRLVIRAELDTVASFSNSPSMWRSTLQWP